MAKGYQTGRRDEAVRAITPSRPPAPTIWAGSIEAGKSADLVVTDGDLLEITTNVEQVCIAGRPIPTESRQTRLFEQYDARPKGDAARGR